SVPLANRMASRKVRLPSAVVLSAKLLTEITSGPADTATWKAAWPELVLALVTVTVTEKGPADGYGWVRGPREARGPAGKVAWAVLSPQLTSTLHGPPVALLSVNDPRLKVPTAFCVPVWLLGAVTVTVAACTSKAPMSTVPLKMRV